MHKGFSRWAKTELCEGVFEGLLDAADNDVIMFEAPLVEAHKQATIGKGFAAIGLWGVPEEDLRSRFICSSMGSGEQLRIFLSPGRSADFLGAPALLEGKKVEGVIADRVYDGRVLRDFTRLKWMREVVPSTRSRKRAIPCNRSAYGERKLVKWYSNKLKHFRRIATLQDRHPHS